MRTAMKTISNLALFALATAIGVQLSPSAFAGQAEIRASLQQVRDQLQSMDDIEATLLTQEDENHQQISELLEKMSAKGNTYDLPTLDQFAKTWKEDASRWETQRTVRNQQKYTGNPFSAAEFKKTNALVRLAQNQVKNAIRLAFRVSLGETHGCHLLASLPNQSLVVPASLLVAGSPSQYSGRLPSANEANLQERYPLLNLPSHTRIGMVALGTKKHPYYIAKACGGNSPTGGLTNCKPQKLAAVKVIEKASPAFAVEQTIAMTPSHEEKPVIKSSFAVKLKAPKTDLTEAQAELPELPDLVHIDVNLDPLAGLGWDTRILPGASARSPGSAP